MWLASDLGAAPRLAAGWRALAREEGGCGGGAAAAAGGTRTKRRESWL